MLKTTQIYSISEDVSTQETTAEVIKLLVIDKLKYNEQLQGCELYIKPFDNCREYGYMYSIIGAKQDITFSVYEHRNSDEIIINGCLTKDVKTYGAYKGNKWDYLSSFNYKEHYDCAERLASFLEGSYLGALDLSILEVE